MHELPKKHELPELHAKPPAPVVLERGDAQKAALAKKKAREAKAKNNVRMEEKKQEDSVPQADASSLVEGSLSQRSGLTCLLSRHVGAVEGIDGQLPKKHELPEVHAKPLECPAVEEKKQEDSVLQATASSRVGLLLDVAMPPPCCPQLPHVAPSAQGGSQVAVSTLGDPQNAPRLSQHEICAIACSIADAFRGKWHD